MAEQTVKATFNAFDKTEASIENSSSELKYFTRYAFVSESGETLSPWSNIEELNQQSISPVLNSFTPNYSVSSVKSGGIGLDIDWTVPESFPIKRFDIYLSWSFDNGSTYTDFIYANTITSNKYYVDIPYSSGIKASFVKIAVQLPTNKKIINTNALLFQTGAISTQPILDAGSIV